MKAAALSPLAERDLLGAVRWIAKDNPAAARGLRRAVVAVSRRIGEYPELGAIRLELASERHRFVVLTGFPHVVVYNSKRRPPMIVRILHGARDLPELLRDL